MTKWLIRLLVVGLLISPSVANAQSEIRLKAINTTGTISANGGSVELRADAIGGFGSVKVQTLDSYSGTWEVQCSVDGTTYDAGTELKLSIADTDTTVLEVVDTVGIWDVKNAAGCRAIKVIATAGFAASNTTLTISATQSGGGGGGGGGAAGTVSISDGTDSALVSAGGELLVSCADCSGSGVSHVDDAAFTPAVSDIVPIAGTFDDAAPDSVNEGDAGVVRMSGNRNLFTTIRDAAGNERGLNVDANGAIAAVVSDGSGALNTIVDSGTLTAVTTITNAVTVTDGAGALNVIVDSGTITANLSATDNAVLDDIADGIAVTGTVTVTDGAGALNVIVDSGTVTANLSATDNAVLDDIADGIDVTCSNCTGSGASFVDDAMFTVATDSGAPIMGLFDAASVDSVDEDDVGTVRMSANRNLFVNIRDNAGNERGLNIDANGAIAAVVSDGSGALNTIVDSGTITAVTTITNAVTVTDGSGSLNVICDSGCSGGTQYAEDAAHASGNTGTLALVVRNDAGMALAADGDNIPLMVNSAGSLYTTVVDPVTVSDGSGALNVICDSGCSGGTQYAEDAAHASGNTGTLALVVRNDAGTALAADGDNIPLMVDANGALFTTTTGSVTVSDGSGALNVIVDSGALTVSDGAGALNVIVDSGTITANLGATDNAVLDDIADGIAVTNAGTFAVQVDGSALTALQLIDNIVSVEDAVAGSAFSGVGFLAVRQDSHSDLAADGDFIPVTVDADGGLRVSIVAGAGSGGTAAADDADFTDGTTSGTPIGGVAEEASPTTVTEGDFGWAAITLNRALKVSLFDTDGGALTPAVDATVGSAIGTSGPAAMRVYSDFDGAALPTATNVDTEGEAVPPAATIKGVQYVMVVNEDGSLERGTATTPTIVGDGSGALNVIVDSGAVTVSDGAGALNTIIDSGTVTTVSTVTTLSQFGGNAINLGSGTIGTGTLRMAIATDDPVNDALVNLDTALNEDEDAFTLGTTQVLAIGAVAESTSDALSDGQVGAPSMTLTRELFVNNRASNTGGATPLIEISDGTNDDEEHEVCATACTIYSVTAFNHAATAAFVRCEADTAANTTPGSEAAGANEPDFEIPGNTAGAGFTVNFGPAGVAYSALTCWVATGEAASDATDVGENDVRVYWVRKL